MRDSGMYSLLRFASDAIIILDANSFEILDVNERTLDIFGYTLDEARALTLRHFCIEAAPYDESALRVHLDTTKRLGSDRYEWRCASTDGETIWLEVTLRLTRVDGSSAIVAFARDIGQRKRAEEELGRARAFLVASIEQSPAAIVLANALGEIELINPAARALARVDPEELGAVRVEDQLRLWDLHDAAGATPNVDELPLTRAVRAGEVSRSRKMYLRRGNSGSRTLLVSAAPVHEADHTRVGAIAVLADVTETEQAESQLRHRHRLEAVGTLAAGVAHEINNPLTGIVNLADMIERGMVHASEVPDCARRIRSLADRMAAIVRSLLTFARQDAQREDQIDPAALVAETVALFRLNLKHARGLVCEVDMHEDLPRVRGRGQQIQQVLLNLLTNAKDAVDASPLEPRRIDVRALRLESEAEPWLRITVADNGPGIPGDVAERIFDPFFTTKPTQRATGLGLWVSHRIVAEHGGRLWFETDPGRGSRFHVDLPGTAANETGSPTP